MNNKKTFVQYVDYYDKFAGLNDAQLGQLYRCILTYQKGLEVKIDDPVTAALFNVVKYDMDADSKKWKEEAKRRSEYGKKAANTRWKNAKACESNESMPHDAHACDRMPVMPHDADSESESDSKLDKSNLRENSRADDLENLEEQEKLIPEKPSIPEDPIPKPPLKPDKRNPLIEKILEWFVHTYGFPPTDVKPRFIANNLVRKTQKLCQEMGKEPTDELVGKGLSNFLDWYAKKDGYANTERLQTVYKKFDIWMAELEERRKQKGAKS